MSHNFVFIFRPNMRLGVLINTVLIKGKYVDLRPEFDSIVLLLQVTVVGLFMQTDHMDSMVNMDPV